MLALRGPSSLEWTKPNLCLTEAQIPVGRGRVKDEGRAGSDYPPCLHPCGSAGSSRQDGDGQRSFGGETVSRKFGFLQKHKILYPGPG